MSVERDRFVDILISFISRVVIELPRDVLEAITKVYSYEDNPLAKEILGMYLKNLDIAKTRRIPLCEDTGILEFFVYVGTRSPYIDIIYDAIIEAVRVATKRIPLRPNAVHPFTYVNSGDNTGSRIPFIHIDLIPGSDILKIWLYVAGGGSSMPTAAKGFPPSEGFKAVRDMAIDVVASYGVNACPPLFIGIGIGPTLDIAAYLSKIALLRRVGERHREQEIARLEEELRRDLNELNIGPQGLGGRVSVIDVFIEYAHRHPASYVGAVTLSCWALRRGLLVVYPDLRYEIPTHGD
ncbi:hydro-lyase, Fe-S type, tartrate/fumarate subfamily, alpha subunit [Ignisphaera aggregans DSM 17230]|uniref:Hydro-lyase, Fe-S type, tartrate/fumarate subfamily, alpha subunit n=1 Tax=Ignisphaera aggregans (strain DSM 17230 / JCM 13409 / AQ1.S1) TaxID=583356 RepID=E0SSD4_IGNAA|nr:hydro-lyase, Fe-S type, tartrate/fumarate subfamily, alpha subunit [Ignisphaera aggregans DSM 17230]